MTKSSSNAGVPRGRIDYGSLSKGDIVGDLAVPTVGRFPPGVGDPRNCYFTPQLDRLPAFMASGLGASYLRYTTADIRKMWGSLQSRFGLSEGRPKGEEEVRKFLTRMLSIPFAGSVFLKCAADNKVTRHLPIRHVNSGVLIPINSLVDACAGDALSVEETAAISLVLNAWVFGQLPPADQYPSITKEIINHPGLNWTNAQVVPGATLAACYEYLDWLRSLDPGAAVSSDELKSGLLDAMDLMVDRPRETTDLGKISEIYDDLVLHLGEILEFESGLENVEEDAKVLETVAKHLRSIAAYAKHFGGRITAATINPLLSKIETQVCASNEATRPQFIIEPLPIAMCEDGAPYLKPEFRAALDRAIESGNGIPPRVEAFVKARGSVAGAGGMVSDAELERLTQARSELLATAREFGARVDVCRDFFTKDFSDHSETGGVDLAAIRAAYVAAVDYNYGVAAHEDKDEEWASLDPVLQAPRNPAAVSTAMLKAAIARLEAETAEVGPPPLPAEPPVPLEAAPPSIDAGVVEPEPDPLPVMELVGSSEFPAADADSVEVATCAPEPGEEGVDPEAPEQISLAAMERLVAQSPGLALALARIHEEATLEELPGGPAFYVLLCAAAASCGVLVPRYDALDRHFDGVMQRIQSTATTDSMGQAYAMAYLAAIAKPALLTSNPQAAYTIHLLSDWLGIPALVSLAPLFEEPVRHALSTNLEALRDASGKGEEARKAGVVQIRSRARQIIDNIEIRHDFNSHRDSQSTWRHLRSQHHPIGTALLALAGDVKGRDLEDALQAAVDLVEEGVDEVVDHAFELHSRAKLIGTNRLRLTSAIERIGEFLTLALRMVRPAQLERDEAARMANYVGRLLSGLSSSIDALASVHYEGPREMARGVLQRVLIDLQSLITQVGKSRPTSTLHEVLLRDLALSDLDLGVEINGASAEGKSLYAVGQEPVIHGDRHQILLQLQACSPRPMVDDSFVEAARSHLDAQRILSANVTISALRVLSPEHPELPSLVAAYETSRTEARMSLQEHAQMARKALARAAFSSLLPPAEIVRKEAAIDSILELSKNLPFEGAIAGPLTNDRPTDFRSAREFLDVMVLEPLAQIHRKAVEGFNAKVAEERSSISADLQPSVDKVLQLARDGQIVSAEEFWTQLQKGQDLPRLTSGTSLLREFHEQYLPAVHHEKGREPLPQGLAKDELQAYRQLMEAWSSLNQSGSVGASRTLMQFLTALVKADVATVGTPQIIGNVGLYEVAGLDFARAVGSEAFVLPVIGSGSKARFRVAVVHGAGSLTTIREALSHGPHLLLTRAKLSIDDRRRLYSDIRKESRGCLIIDDHLMHFAAAKPSSVAARVLSVASSFLYTEPYKVEDATTPEMYFGRRAARRQIFEARAALIFGGRRLGKSSIIADICRRETSPAQKKFYVHVELSQFMEAEKYEEEVWRRIAQALLATHAVSNTTIQFNMGNPKAVLDTLKKGFAEDRITHLTLYLDEADRFMKLEESTNFNVLYELSTEITQRYPDRFSYAISGLNNVQRISLGWNSRLGRIGNPIAITPFIDEDRHEGLRLIVEPLAALGFEFESPDLPLQILSAASFYPALIQGYCSKLLELLYKKPIGGVAPYVITQNDLATTEATEDLRRKFLDIFKLTVLLDNRYMVVSAILAEEQELREGADVSMHLSAISERAVQVAPDLFPKSDPTTIVEAAAESLINLGLLVRQPHTQQYQFRSPRILSKIREISQVADFLKGAGNRQQFVDHDPAEHRPLFADRSICPLPERLVNSVCAPAMAGESTRFITGSEASGLARLRKLGSDSTWAARRVNVRGAHADSESLLKDFIGQITKTRDIGRQKLTLHRVPIERELVVVGGNWLPSTPNRIAAVDATLQSEHRSVLLVCEPDRAWDLAALPGARMTYLPHWTPAALRLHLQAIELPDFTGEDALRRILECTGGCTALIESACQWISARRSLPNTMEILQALRITDTKGLYGLFGLRPEHAGILNDLPAQPQPRKDLERLFKNQDVDAVRLFTYLEWMGALQVDEAGRWSLNSVLTTALLEFL